MLEEFNVCRAVAREMTGLEKDGGLLPAALHVRLEGLCFPSDNTAGRKKGWMRRGNGEATGRDLYMRRFVHGICGEEYAL